MKKTKAQVWQEFVDHLEAYMGIECWDAAGRAKAVAKALRLAKKCGAKPR